MTFGVGFVLGVGCTAFTLGIGALACGVVSGALSSALGAALDGESWTGVLREAAIGGAFGALGSVVGNAGGTFVGKAIYNTVKGVRSSGVATIGNIAKSAVRSAGRDAFTALEDLGKSASRSALRPKNLKSIWKMHAAVIRYSSPNKGWGTMVGSVLKDAAPGAFGAGALGTFAPTSVDQILDYKPSPLNGVNSFFTGI